MIGDSGSKPSSLGLFDKSSSLENSAKKLNFSKIGAQNSEPAADSLQS